MDLKSICNDLLEEPEGVSEDIRNRIMTVCQGHGALEIRFFGALARGEANLQSRIELLVNMEEGRSLIDLVSIKQDLEDILGRKVDVLTKNSISPHIKNDLLKNTI